MNRPDVIIQRGLPDHLRPQAAVVFDEAFGTKLSKAIPSKDKRLTFLEHGLVADHAVVALVGDELAGMAGLDSADGGFAGGLISETSMSLRETIELLGNWGAARAEFVLANASHKPEPGELYVDGIAVATEARGQGIGTKLLDEVASIARSDGYRCVRLEVVDTNPRAQELYEREGYRVIKVDRLGFLRRFIGFGGVTTMELAIDRA